MLSCWCFNPNDDHSALTGVPALTHPPGILAAPKLVLFALAASFKVNHSSAILAKETPLSRFGI